MSVIEMVGAILLIISCVSIVLLVLSQDSKKGLSQSLTGSSSDNYYQKNSTRTKEAQLKRITKLATIVLFVVTLAVNIFAILGKDAPETLPDEEQVVTLPDDTFSLVDGEEGAEDAESSIIDDADPSDDAATDDVATDEATDAATDEAAPDEAVADATTDEAVATEAATEG